jgi:uncharacterized protein with GYD domain
MSPKLVESMSGKVREALYTISEYDIAFITEFPDDETATAALLQAGSFRSVRTNTMRAFTGDEMDGIISRPAKRGQITPGLWNEARRAAVPPSQPVSDYSC